MAQKRKFHFSLVRHYDKALAVLALALLLFSLFVLARSGTENRKRDKAVRREVEKKVPAHPRAEPLDTQGYDRALRTLRRPQPMEVSTNGYGFFLPELRVWCVNSDCRHAIPFSSETCPFCEAKQPPPPAVGLEDSEGKGIPDKWRKTHFGHGFASGDDKSLADDDADGDGFSNQEEFRDDTNPRDPASHAELVSKLRFKEVRSKPFPFVFTSATQMPDQTWRVFVNMKAENRMFAVKQGQAVGNTGLVFTNYVRRIEQRKSASVGFVNVDLSEMQLLRSSDGLSFVLPINHSRAIMEQELVLDLVVSGNHTEYRVVLGGFLKLAGERYRINLFDDKSYSVVLENVLTGKRYTVSR